MTKQHAQATVTDDELARGLRDGLLQDLLAVALLIEGARARVDDHDAASARELLHDAGATVRADITTVRALIARLREADARPMPGSPARER